MHAVSAGMGGLLGSWHELFYPQTSPFIQDGAIPSQNDQHVRCALCPVSGRPHDTMGVEGLMFRRYAGQAISTANPLVFQHSSYLLIPDCLSPLFGARHLETHILVDPCGGMNTQPPQSWPPQHRGTTLGAVALPRPESGPAPPADPPHPPTDWCGPSTGRRPYRCPRAAGLAYVPHRDRQADPHKSAEGRVANALYLPHRVHGSGSTLCSTLCSTPSTLCSTPSTLCSTPSTLCMHA